MSLVQTTAGILEIAFDPAHVDAAKEAATRLGGFAIDAAGNAVVGHLAVNGVGRLWERMKDAQQRGEIPRDFDSTSHGQAMFQEALRALLSGLDQDRAEAVQRVFLGLATTPPKDAAARAEQLYILSLVSGLSTWEVIAINQLERYRLVVRDKRLVDLYQKARSDAERTNVLDEARSTPMKRFGEWTDELGEIDPSQKRLLYSLGMKPLSEKNITRGADLDNEPFLFRFHPLGNFTELGWKLVVHLYSAEAGSENDAERA